MKQIEDFERIEGGVHGMPALIAGVTDEPLFFYDGHTFANIDDFEDGIDHFAGKQGYFVVRKGRKAIAERKVQLHDEYRIDW